MSGHSTTACSRRLDASHEARTACHAQFRSACDTDSMRLNSYRPETHPPKSPNPLPSPLPQLEAVLRCVQDILERGPDERIIVFSTWRDVLRLLEHAFGRNAVPHAHPQTRKALAPAFAAFQVGPGAGAGSATPRVLLLLVKQGGNGLNLTAAQHVILVEPLRSPGLEAQAVGRVDRVGQLRETHVYRWDSGVDFTEGGRRGRRRGGGASLPLASTGGRLELGCDVQHSRLPVSYFRAADWSAMRVINPALDMCMAVLRARWRRA